MKWSKTTAVILITLAISLPVHAEQEGPWGFENIAVINIPTRDIVAHRTIDRRGVVLSFKHWSPEIEKAIVKSLDSSPLQYRFHPARQAVMSVEVYSKYSDVDHAARHQKHATQIIIGEVRLETSISDLLKQETEIHPVPEVAELVRLGKMTGAKKALSTHKGGKKPGDKFLFRTRLSLLDYAKKRRSAVKCPSIHSVREGDRENIAAILLNGWCHRERGQTDDALRYVDLIKRVRPETKVMNRTKALEKLILSGQIMRLDRKHETLRAAALSVRHLPLFEEWLKNVHFIETVAKNLNATGLSAPLSKMIQRLMAKRKSKRQGRLEGLLVETYLAADQHVLAMDAAHYFLTKKQPIWNAGRLHRGMAHAMMQAGDWQGASEGFAQAKTYGAPWNTDDDLAFLETDMRNNAPLDVIVPRMEKLFLKEKVLTKFQAKWLGRLAAEIDLRSGRIPKEKLLAKLPEHVLARTAQRVDAEGKKEIARQMLERVVKGKGGWSKLAKNILEIEKMRQQFEEIKSAMEKVR